MLNLEQIEQVVTMVANSQLVEVTISTNHQSLRVKNNTHALANAIEPSNDLNVNPLSQPISTPTTIQPAIQPKQIISPHIGKVQLGADTVTPVFKHIGDNVAVGDTVSVVAQLGRLLPVKSEQAGVITEILVESNQRVEYGTPLFVLG